MEKETSSLAYYQCPQCPWNFPVLVYLSGNYLYLRILYCMCSTWLQCYRSLHQQKICREALPEYIQTFQGHVSLHSWHSPLQWYGQCYTHVPLTEVLGVILIKIWRGFGPDRPRDTPASALLVIVRVLSLTWSWWYEKACGLRWLLLCMPIAPIPKWLWMSRKFYSRLMK